MSESSPFTPEDAENFRRDVRTIIHLLGISKTENLSREFTAIINPVDRHAIAVKMTEPKDLHRETVFSAVFLLEEPPFYSDNIHEIIPSGIATTEFSDEILHLSDENSIKFAQTIAREINIKAETIRNQDDISDWEAEVFFCKKRAN